MVNETQQVVLDEIHAHILSVLDQTEEVIPQDFRKTFYTLLETSVSHPAYENFTRVINTIFPDYPGSSNKMIRDNFLRFYHLAESNIPDDDWIVENIKKLGSDNITTTKQVIATNVTTWIREWKNSKENTSKELT